MPKLTAISLLLALVAAAAGGCASQHADWQEARHILEDSREIAEGFRPVAELREREKELDRVVDYMDRAIAAVDRQIEEGGEDDSAAVEAVRLVLDISGEIIAEWPNPHERAVASAVYSATRVALRTAHRRIDARREDGE